MPFRSSCKCVCGCFCVCFDAQLHLGDGRSDEHIHERGFEPLQAGAMPPNNG